MFKKSFRFLAGFVVVVVTSYLQLTVAQDNRLSFRVPGNAPVFKDNNELVGFILQLVGGSAGSSSIDASVNLVVNNMSTFDLEGPGVCTRPAENKLECTFYLLEQERSMRLELFTNGGMLGNIWLIESTEEGGRVIAGPVAVVPILD